MSEHSTRLSLHWFLSVTDSRSVTYLVCTFKTAVSQTLSELIQTLHAGVATLGTEYWILKLEPVGQRCGCVTDTGVSHRNSTSTCASVIQTRPGSK